MAAEPEKIEAFVAGLRANVRDLLEEMKDDGALGVPDLEELFAPPTVTAALLLSAFDYCMERNLRPDQFVHTLRVLATKMEADMGLPPMKPDDS